VWSEERFLFSQTQIQPFSQKSRTATVPKLFPIGLCGVVEADSELFCNSWSAGFLGERLYARTSHGMASESLSRGIDLFFAQEFCFFKQEHGPPSGSKQVKTDVLLTTVLSPLRSGSGPSGANTACHSLCAPEPPPSRRHVSAAVRWWSPRPPRPPHGTGGCPFPPPPQPL